MERKEKEKTEKMKDEKVDEETTVCTVHQNQKNPPTTTSNSITIDVASVGKGQVKISFMWSVNVGMGIWVIIKKDILYLPDCTIC